MKVWNEEVSFYDLIKADKEISSILSDEEIDDIFDLNYHLKQVETIFKRVLK
jgi:adenylosuccinate lyase